MKEFNKRYKLPVKSMHGMAFDKQAFHVLDIIEDSIESDLIKLINGEPVKVNVPLPVSYVNSPATRIKDANGKEIISIRGWGRLSKLADGDRIQDAIGNEIAELINFNLNGEGK